MLAAAMRTPVHAGTQPGVGIFAFEDLPWQDTSEPGLRLKPVRYDDERGLYLGWVNFAPMARSGLHQHRGVATSFVVDGGLTDYHGAIGLHQVGINLVGATHDAVAYQNTVLVSRLEGPVVYPPEHGSLSGLHAGSRHAEVVIPAPEVPPEINVDVDALPAWQSGIAGLRRQTVFDYAGTGSPHRMLQWQLAPGCALPRWRAGAATELWLRGGRLLVNGHLVRANSIVVIDAGAEVELAAPFGALALVWAEGAEQWPGEAPINAPASALASNVSLFGF
jgi:hypothetical protein